MGIESEVIWMDGQLVPFADAKVHVLSHTLHYGVGVFEGIRSYAQPDGSGGVWRLDAHVRRLLESAKMCRMEVPFSHAQVAAACVDTLRANRMPEAYIRPLIFFGMGRMGLGARDNPVHTSVAVWDWGKYLGEEGIRNGIRVQISTFTRSHVNATLQRAKVVGHYVNSVLARYEAIDNGYDEAILLDAQGWVAEGTGENVFVIRDGEVFTPPVVNILGGITRAAVIEILKQEGITVHERPFGRDALYVADELFLTGSAAEVTPVREVDRRLIGPPGPITKRVQEVFAKGVLGEVPYLREGITRFTV
jgi:branched-chain amino acid aminotransferase